MTARHTSGPWEAVRLVHEDTGEPMTPEQLGEYVTNAVQKSAGESGTTDYLAVLATKPDGPCDVCHVGNGPDGPSNARLIASAPDMHAFIIRWREIIGGGEKSAEGWAQDFDREAAEVLRKAGGA